jgi:Tol biopolymer transport system component
MRSRGLAFAASIAMVVGCGQAPSPSGSTAAPSQRSAASPVPSASTAVVPVPAGLIAFDSYQAEAGAEGPYLGTFVIRGDGNGQRALTVPIEVEGLTPAWSRDGKRLVVNVWTPPNGPGRPAILNADGSGFSEIQPRGLAADMGCSDWSPDGHTLLCSVSGGPRGQLDGIYTVRTDGTGLTRLTTSPFHDTVGTAGECGGGENRGVFSPDGSKIVYVRQKCGIGPDPSSDESAALELIDRTGKNLREIVPQGQVKSHPGGQVSWSPDTTRIALGSQEGELFLVRPDGTDLVQIPISTPSPHHAYGPSWSPDGTRIVFSMWTETAGSTDLYTISPDGSNLIKITDGLGAEAWPRWGVAASP